MIFVFTVLINEMRQEQCYTPCISGVAAGDIYCYGGQKFMCKTGVANWCNLLGYNFSFTYWGLAWEKKGDCTL